MEFNSVTQIAYYSAAFLSAILTIAFFYQKIKNHLPWSLGIASLIQTVWLVTIAKQGQITYPSLTLIFQLETLHYVGWILAITRTTEKLCTHSLPKLYKIFVYSISAAALGLAVFLQFREIETKLLLYLVFWQGILMPILGLLSVEQLYRNNTKYRVIKLLCLVMAATYIFDAYLFTQDLLFSNFDIELWQARAAVVMASAVLMITGLTTLAQPTEAPVKLNFSRPIIFYTTSLSIAGALLTILSFGGYYVHLYGGSWGTVIYTGLLVTAVVLIGSILISRGIREKLSVLIDKHLFSYKYDYRTEWIKLINQLSRTDDETDPPARTLRVAADLFKCDGGALWVKRSQVLVPVVKNNMPFDISGTVEPEQSEFCKALTEEWVFSPRSLGGDLSQYNELLPDWIRQIDHIQMIFPLLTERKLAGFIVLTNRENLAPLNWEDLDLIKTVGRQFASYLTRHEQAEQLTEVRQFDAFNKLSAFVMHDLKNLIAQQSLVVKNAEKHKDNPAFVEDAINTINNSVVRMNNLLRKLQHNEPDHVKTLKLKEVLIEAVKRCQKTPPTPTIVPITSDIKIKADFDSLVMVFTHIIHNAQDATPNNGYIDITAKLEEGFVMITIEDSGIGMDLDFIQNKLFKPFETTKSGKGMGVGVYQAREYIGSIGGSIRVESTPNVGTTFIINIPVM